MAQTIIERFDERVRKHPDRVALRFKKAGQWQTITWREYGEIVKRVGKALMSLGVERGDKVAILSSNRPAWHSTDIGCMSVGGVTAPIYVTNSPEQVAYIVGHSESKVVVVEDPEQLDKVLKMRGELPSLRKIVVIEGYGNDADPELVMTWEQFLDAGGEIGDAAYDERVRDVDPDSVATFVYTSGTTGPPKAVMLTHGNVWWTAEHSERHIPIGDESIKRPDTSHDGRALSYLPLSHIAERMISHLLQIYYGTETWFAESLETLQADLQACKPTYFFGVPRVWEKFYAGFQAKAAVPPHSAGEKLKKKIARKAIQVGREITELEQQAVSQGKKMSEAAVPGALGFQHRLLDKIALHKIREAFGLEECKLPLSAAAPLNPELIWFFHSIGIKITEGYGQSEDNGPTTWNPPEAVKIGTVGTPFPDLEVKIGDDGEILVRGGNVMKGYYKDEQATAETIDSEGWLHSGDIGEFDEHNYLRITDRKKELIITAGGKNIAPSQIEEKIKFHPLISQVVVIGDQRPFLSAIITLDPEKAPAWGKEQGIDGDIETLAYSDRLLKEIEGHLNEVNQSLAKVEGIKKFRVLSRDFLQEENEITPTMKVKRRQIAKLYGDVIEDMYSKESPNAAGAKAPVRT